MDALELPIERISISGRVRKEFGDLQALADSIAEIGLLQPIGVTQQYELVFGERRLRAIRDILQWKMIPVRIVRLGALLLGEYHENELRKDFTISERVEIGKKIEALLGERRGRPSEDKRENFPELQGKRNREIAGEKAGFSSDRT